MSSGISIIIPVYNREGLISRSIDSCLAQSHQDFEVLVVDDASMDKTRDVVEGYTDKRIKYIYCPVRGGVSVARNIGLSLARYDYVTFLDSDDEMLPTRLEKSLDAMRVNLGVSVVMSRGEVVCDRTNRVIYTDTEWSHRPDIHAKVMKENFGHSLMSGHLYRKEGLPFFDPEIQAGEDLQFNMRVIQEDNTVMLDEVLTRVHKNHGYSRSKQTLAMLLKLHKSLLRNVVGISKLRRYYKLAIGIALLFPPGYYCIKMALRIRSKIMGGGGG